jgi:putative tricarboxylic transport membrane protein
VNRDVALGLVLLALSGAYFASARTIPLGDLSDAVGPQGLPRAYAALLTMLAVVLIIRGWLRPSPATFTPSTPAPSTLTLPKVALLRAAGILAIGALYLALVPWAGYPVTMAGLLIGTTYYQGGRLDRRVVMIGVVGAAVLWVVFVQVLGIDHPTGVWIERLLGLS